MNHTVPQYSFHISYSFCHITHLLSFAAVRSFLRSKPTVFALLHLLGSHVASDTLQTKATRSDIFDLISLSASYTRIWRCVHQHYNDCDIDEEDIFRCFDRRMRERETQHSSLPSHSAIGAPVALYFRTVFSYNNIMMVYNIYVFCHFLLLKPQQRFELGVS